MKKRESSLKEDIKSTYQNLIVWAESFTSNEQDAKDLVQETVLKALQYEVKNNNFI